MSTSTSPPDTAASVSQRGLALECRDVTIDLDTGDETRRIVSGLDVRIEPGQFVCVLGESGVGKTTVLRALGGLIPAAAGSRIELGGRAIDGPPEDAVTVFQNYAASLLPWRTARANVELAIEGRFAKAERRRRALEALEMVGLVDRAGDYPWQMSGGMQQRVQLARALVLEPRLLLMDEPFGALDAMTRESLQDQLLRIHRSSGATIVFITHDIDEAVYLADRMLVLVGRPSKVGLDLPSTLGRQRDQVETKESPEYLRLRHLVYSAVRMRGSSDA